MTVSSWNNRRLHFSDCAVSVLAFRFSALRAREQIKFVEVVGTFMGVASSFPSQDATGVESKVYMKTANGIPNESLWLHVQVLRGKHFVWRSWEPFFDTESLQNTLHALCRGFFCINCGIVWLAIDSLILFWSYFFIVLEPIPLHFTLWDLCINKQTHMH